MQSASVSMLKARLSEYLHKVKKGMDIYITEHRRPIAKLSPINRGGKALDPDMAELIRAGILRPGRKGGVRPSLLRPSPAKDPRGLVLKALLEERARERKL